MVNIYICPLINTPSHLGGDNQPTIFFRFLGVIFDGDHDFEDLRSPRAHLDTVLRKLSRHLRRPFKDRSPGGGDWPVRFIRRRLYFSQWSPENVFQRVGSVFHG